MNKNRLSQLLLLLCSAFSSNLAATPGDSPKNQHGLLGGLRGSVGDAFTGRNAMYHIMAIALTPVLIQSGADMEVHNYFVDHQMFHPATIPAVWGTYLLPAVLGGGLYYAGRSENHEREALAASAIAQTALISTAYQSILKGLTGRPPPTTEKLTLADTERFHFGFLEGGVHWGWPSGHMMLTTSMYIALLKVYPNHQALKWGGAAWWTYVLASVLIHEQSHMHYLSDAVAGTLMGVAIGLAVGDNISPVSQSNESGDDRNRADSSATLSHRSPLELNLSYKF